MQISLKLQRSDREHSGAPMSRAGNGRKERTGAVLPGVSLQGDSKLKIVDRVSMQPGSTAGDVAKALDFERTVTGTSSCRWLRAAS